MKQTHQLATLFSKLSNGRLERFNYNVGAHHLTIGVSTNPPNPCYYDLVCHQISGLTFHTTPAKDNPTQSPTIPPYYMERSEIAGLAYSPPSLEDYIPPAIHLTSITYIAKQEKITFTHVHELPYNNYQGEFNIQCQLSNATTLLIKANKIRINNQVFTLPNTPIIDTNPPYKEQTQIKHQET